MNKQPAKSSDSAPRNDAAEAARAQRFSAATALVGVVLGTLGATFVGWWQKSADVDLSVAQRSAEANRHAADLQLQYISLAVGILGKEKGRGEIPVEQQALRRWAATLLNAKLEPSLRLDAAAINALSAGRATLPSMKVTYNSGYTAPVYDSGYAYTAPQFQSYDYTAPEVSGVAASAPAGRRAASSSH